MVKLLQAPDRKSSQGSEKVLEKPWSVSRDPEFFYTQAERLVTEGKFVAAELMLRQANELGGDNQVYAACLSAFLSMQEGREEEALALVREHLVQFPDEPSLLVAQALAAKATHQPELAESSLRQAVEVNSNHAFAHHSLSKVLIDKGQLGEAETHACKAFALVPDQPDYALTAIDLLEQAGKHDYAFEVASLGASFCPQEMALVQKAVEGALAREEPQRAWEALEESNEDLPWVLGWKANLLEHQGETEKADALLEQGRERFPEDPDFLFLEAAILVRRGLTEEALQAIEQLLLLVPTHRGALRLRADLSLGSEATEEALADLKAMLELEPADAEVAQELASSYYRARRFRECLDVCQDWEGRQPLTPPLLVYLVLSLAGLGEPQEALERFPDLASEWIVPALTELNGYGCGNSAEEALRERLLLAVPEASPEAQGAEAEAADWEEDSEGESPGGEEVEDAAQSEEVEFRRASQAPESESEAEEEAQEGGRFLAESPAYEDDDDPEVWVEIDEETGEEYVWIEDDEEEDE